VPGYGIFGGARGVRLGRAHEITLDVEKIGDEDYRAIGWDRFWLTHSS
jgi:hypothetical protein